MVNQLHILGVVIFVIAFTSWTYMARIVRGQVMAMLRQLGHVPPGTDYLFFHLTL